jgi:opacity protein-like surface antigen
MSRRPAVKHKLVCALVAITLLIPALSFAAPLVFSMSPGQVVQSAQVGMSMGSLMPYVGLDLMGVSGKVKVNYTSSFGYYDEFNNFTEGTLRESEDIKASAMLLIPHIGARFYFATEPLKPYVYTGFLKSLPFVSAKESYSARLYDESGHLLESQSSSSELTGDAKDAVTHPLGFWGLNLGFGAEYPFSENFSLGGEYGLRWFHTGSKSAGSSGSGGDSFLTDALDSEMTASLKLTTARIVLNYQF